MARRRRKQQAEEEPRQRALITASSSRFVTDRFWDILWYYNTYLGGVPKGTVVDTEAMTIDLPGWRLEFRLFSPTWKKIPDWGLYDFTVPFNDPLEPRHTYDHVLHDVPHLMTIVSGVKWEPMHVWELYDAMTEHRREKEKESGKKYRNADARTTVRPPRRDQRDALPYEEAVRPVRRHSGGKVRRDQDL